MKMDYRLVIERLGILARLESFQPMVIGTPPLGIALEESDLDIACWTADLDDFDRVIRVAYHSFNDFQIRRTSHQEQDVSLATFTAFGWQIEVFCQTLLTERQWGVRHFRVEERLLRLRPELRAIVIANKQAGMKTEPTFASALGLSGDPYQAVLALENCDDRELSSLAIPN